MVTLFGLLNIGRSGIFASQSGLNTTGNNISNADTEGYSRQRVHLTNEMPLPLTPGSVGTGVQVKAFERFRDTFLETQVRDQISRRGFLERQEEGFDNVQVLLNDPLSPVASSLDNPSEAGLNYVLKEFFSAFQELSTHPESVAVRSAVVQKAVTLADTMNLMGSELQRLQDDMNKRVEIMVEDINELTTQIADLNVEISSIESDDRNNANDLRDQRDLLLRRLSEKVPIQVFEGEQGEVLVSVLGVAVVDRANSTDILADTVESAENTMLDIFFDLPGSRVATDDFERGELGGLLDVRDRILPSLLNDVDELSDAIIDEVNKVHSRNMGLSRYEETISEFVAESTTLPLPDVCETCDIQAGTFTIRIEDTEGVVQQLADIDFAMTDSLDDIAANITAAGGGQVSAFVNSQNKLVISAANGFQFGFQGDTSNVLAALGVNTFFSGSSAINMAVREEIESDLTLLAVSSSGAPGDNSAAIEIAQLEYAGVLENGQTSFGDFYRSRVAEIGVEAQRVIQTRASAESMVKSLDDAQEAVAGVSLDEEAINLIRFQQAFAASARFVSTTDEMIDIIVNRMGV